MDKSLALFIVQALISSMSLVFCFSMLAWSAVDSGERSLLYSTVSLIIGMWMRKPSFSSSSSTKKPGSTSSTASTPSSSAPEYSDPPTPPHVVVNLESNK